MKIALINGSPRIKESASSYILKDLKSLIDDGQNIISEYHFSNPQVGEKYMNELIQCDAIVFAFPLYVDGIPSHLLNNLIKLEMFFSLNKEKDIMVYSIVNCGFYEGHQAKIAIEMMENWCKKSGLKWGQGLGIGAGAMMPFLRNIPAGSGPKKNIDYAVNQLACNILKSSSSENIFISPNFPGFLYRITAEMSFRRNIKENGLKVRDIYTRI
ncbi:MAG TPA: hypothetical protein VIK77_06685 [Tissierellaceae bacterium]